jgi:hypothetical protein
MSTHFKAGLLVAAAVAFNLAAGSASAAEVFAEPTSAKGQQGYALTVFPAAGEEGVSFTFQLDRGIKGLDLSKCGGEQADGASRCLYAPETGKLAVVLFRLDGQPLANREYSLGQVMFPGGARQKLATLQADDVTSGSRSSQGNRQTVRHSTNAER